jgi:hypothetical protein
VIELVRVRLLRREWLDFDGEKRWLTLLELDEVLVKVTRDVDGLLPRTSLGTMISCSSTLSSRFRLRRVAVEAVEIRRDRAVGNGTLNSSIISAVSTG